MKGDPLAALMRLRGLQVAAARRDLADRQAGAQAAVGRAEAAVAVLAQETQGEVAFLADSLAAWLPGARAARERAAGEARLAGQAVEAARAALVASRAQERAVEWLMESRAAAARQKVARGQQAALDETAQQRAGRGKGS
ncbi:hypothetical protein [Falsiroseomonas selenitidurans]|uniref:Flagellar FliJ protein n=1 Tax=Falsiroseomonas selenitidurans TaxID=2716335 RepID=A0ABX1ECH4_9PROT|nr:hypothetical protein [Falsiroseomonas selenitidurans]NKC34536.1 hypothetical protein [Falsiroseomonas selenitidurans]